VPQH